MMKTITQRNDRHCDMKENDENAGATPPRWCRRFGELFPLGAKWILDGVRGGIHLRPHHQLEEDLQQSPPSSLATPQQRLSAVQWLVRMNASSVNFQCGPETLFLAVQYLDRILDAEIDPDLKQLILGPPHQCAMPRKANHALVALYLPAVVCLSLAAKYNDEFAAASSRAVCVVLSMAHNCMRTLTLRQIADCERAILTVLEYRLAGIAPSTAAFEVICAAPHTTAQIAAVADGDGAAAQSSKMPGSSLLPPMSTSRASLADERWPVAMCDPQRRSVLARVVRAVQVEMVQRTLEHPSATRVAPAPLGMVLLSRALDRVALELMGSARGHKFDGCRLDLVWIKRLDPAAFDVANRVVQESCPSVM
ncbi:hypothetical protein BC828DRAFT_381263 [Blastocladiella britannica]|nr:hypothetical protein BC828DRAFT_381263 [Blastocladiella britannica]